LYWKEKIKQELRSKEIRKERRNTEKERKE
jgi:hypothetical protein